MTVVGGLEGESEGVILGAFFDATDRDALGAPLGNFEGKLVLGDALGALLGDVLGEVLGEVLGIRVLGAPVGCWSAVGPSLGDTDGLGLSVRSELGMEEYVGC